MAEGEKAVFRIVIRGSIDSVWREITKTDELQKCMFNMRLETDGLKPGGQIRMRSPSGKYTDVVGEVLEFNPPHRYVHTFRFTKFDDPPCTVIHELKEVDGGVEYTLTHENLAAGQIDIVITDPTSSVPQIRAGNIKGYAITAAKRIAAAPEIPTVDEAGLPGFYVATWNGLLAPKGTPKSIIAPSLMHANSNSK